MTSPSQARLTVDLAALAHNYTVIAAEAGGAEVAPVVKADGYGLGAAQVGRRLAAEGARSFFVARLGEGEALRAALGPGPAIYVLDGLAAGSAGRLAAAGLTPVLSTLPQAAGARAWAAANGPLAVALQADTGMNRQGLSLADASALAHAPHRLAGLDVRLVMSHLGSGSDPEDARNGEQLARFREFRGLFPDKPASLAASGGIFLSRDYHFDLVRPGIGLYGGGPRERPDPALRAVAGLTAPILDIRSLSPGDRVGYGSSFTASRAMRVAVVAAGYADGVIRAAKSGGYAWLAGARRPLLVVTMDLLVVEIGEAPARIGEHIELLGPNVALDDLAATAGTVAHEILVRLSARAERIYLD